MVKLLIADDHAIVREGLKQIVQQTSDITVAGEAIDAIDTMHKLAKLDVSMLLLDISMPGRSGLDVLIQVKQEYPHIPVLILSLHTEDQYAIRTLRAGASGYVTKETAPEELIIAIRRVAQGGRYISAAIAERIAFNVAGQLSVEPHELLSNREFQVFRMLAMGQTVTDIADELMLSVKTISTNRTRILEKMHLKTNADLTQYAMNHKLIG